MSNLDYSISVLVAEGKGISSLPKVSGKNQVQRKNRLDGITRAVSILAQVANDDEKEKHLGEQLLKK